MQADDSGSVLARLRRPTTTESVRLAVIADPHVATRSAGSSKLFEHTLDHFAAALADIEDRDVDAVLSPGDLTKDGEPWNVEAVDDVLDDLAVPVYAVPGNHDVSKADEAHESLTPGEFADRFGPGTLPFRVTVGDLDVLGLNTAGSADRLTDTHDGDVDAEQLDWLEAVLDDVADPLVLLHHNLQSVTEQLRRHREQVAPNMEMPPVMADPGPLVDVLARGDVSLVLTGHFHLPATGVDRGVREIAAPTTCSFPQSYLLLDVTPRGTLVRLVPVADCDGLERGHHERIGDSETARGLTSIAAARLASLPLADDGEFG